MGTSEVNWAYLYDDRGWPYRVVWNFNLHSDLRSKVAGWGEGRIDQARLGTQYRNWDKPMTIIAPKAKPGRGLAVDEFSDVLSAPARRR
ncbi:hypothetical protein GCM10014719_71700 [Planomonospora parontospora subsp. antibiotica]|uniref:hypothetical protein n=1 Tax=Planomonospora parontospora TaxID=58119 RepID=UPI001670DD89|nr:hypothetical protein [Planomonospora parontospora]GGL60251.1 hypothetical protein GCM10014719_71700 [Planomonospora parontospora subsp. antibiotica]